MLNNINKKAIFIPSNLINILIIGLIVFSVLNIQKNSITNSVPIPGGDAYQYFVTAYNLAQHNVHSYDQSNKPEPSFYREPLFPFFLSLGYRFLGLNDNVNLDCLFNQINECNKYLYAGKYLNYLYFILILFIAYFFLKEFKINKTISLISILIMSNNPLIITYINDYLTEVLSSLLFIISSFCIYKIFIYKNIESKKIIILSLLFSLLIMTKFIYFFTIYACAIFILLIYLSKFLINKQKNSLELNEAFNLKQVFIFLVIVFLIPTMWKIRNYQEIGYFELSPRGYAGAIMQRLEYITMTEEEKKAGHILYMVKGDIRSEMLKKIDPKNLERFDLSCDNLENWYCKAFSDESQVLSRVDPMNRKLFYEIKRESINVLLENFRKHFYLSPLFLQRGSLEVINGLPDNNSIKTLFYRYFHVINYILMFFGILYSALKRNFLLFILSLPLIYHYSIYSLLTHFEPRYSILTLNYIFIFNLILIDTIVRKLKWNLIKKK